MSTQSTAQKMEPQEKVSIKFFLRLFIPLALAFFMSALLRTINSVMAPTFIETFSMTASDLGVMTSAYFLTFAIAQIPLGICFDRYGPNKTLGIFMIAAVIGCFLFASAQVVTMLFIGRALVGLGVAGCLMAAYKSFGDWLPKNKLPMYNSMESFVGGVGGMVATTPINLALGFMSWRAIFVVLGVMTLIVAIMCYFAPNKKGNQNESLAIQVKGVGEIARAGRFWRLAPVAVFGQATYLALNGLWIGPWFRDVFGASAESVPNFLLLSASAITIGYLINGFVANALKSKYKINVFKTTIVSMSAYTVILLLIAALPQYGNILWPLFMLLGPFSLLTYPIFSDMFPSGMSGRAQTMYNMLVFIMSTVMQSGVGFIIDLFPEVNGSYNPMGYTVSFYVLGGCLVLSIIWALLFRRNENEINY